MRLNGECHGMPGFEGHNINCTSCITGPNKHAPDEFPMRYQKHYEKLENGREGYVHSILRSLYGEPNTHPVLVEFPHIDELSHPHRWIQTHTMMNGYTRFSYELYTAHGRFAYLELIKIDHYSMPPDHTCTVNRCG